MRHEKVDMAASRLIVLPHIDPARGRAEMTVAAETTVAEMVTLAFPGLPVATLDRVRVSIGEHVIAREAWRHVRPKPGASVIIRVVPGDDTLRSVLSVAVLVAAVALGQFYAPAIAGGLTGGLTGYGGFALTGLSATFASGLATAGLAIAGNLLLNALIPTVAWATRTRAPISMPSPDCRTATIRVALSRRFWGGTGMLQYMPRRHIPKLSATTNM